MVAHTVVFANEKSTGGPSIPAIRFIYFFDSPFFIKKISLDQIKHRIECVVFSSWLMLGPSADSNIIWIIFLAQLPH